MNAYSFLFAADPSGGGGEVPSYSSMVSSANSVAKGVPFLGASSALPREGVQMAYSLSTV